MPNVLQVSMNFALEWWQTDLVTNIAAIGELLLVVTPWTDARVFIRAWCLWELWCAISRDVCCIFAACLSSVINYEIAAAL